LTEAEWKRLNGDPGTELESLRASNNYLREMLIERDKREALEKIRAEADRARAAQIALVEAQGKERAASMERHRRHSWFDHELEECRRTHDDTRFRKFLQKSIEQHEADAPEGWAPGYCPAMYMDVSAFAPSSNQARRDGLITASTPGFRWSAPSVLLGSEVSSSIYRY
jgi:hypothetical protein